MRTLIILSSFSLTANIFMANGLLVSRDNNAELKKSMETWRSLSIKQDTQLLQQQETIREAGETLVACLNKAGLK